MSPGDGRDKSLSEKENLQSMRKKRKLGTDEFAQAVARNVVAQVCESLGFQSSQQFALNNLADIAVRYIREIGKTASSYANLANRTQCNVFDVIEGLEGLGSAQGFSGASNVRHSLSGSGVVKDIIRYVSQVEEIPFAYPVPIFPVAKERILDHNLAKAEEKPPSEHIPSWLPKFPDPVTYAELSSGNEKDSETEVVEQQRRNFERSLQKLQQKLICNGSEAGVVEQGYAEKAQRGGGNNPFLASPLQFCEKEVSLPTFRARLMDESLGCRESHEHVSILEPSSKANEAARSGPCEPEDRRKIPLNGRPNVQFKVRSVKKFLSLVTNPRNEGSKKNSLWFGLDYDGTVEKKVRVEKILQENAEHPPKVRCLIMHHRSEANGEDEDHEEVG